MAPNHESHIVVIRKNCAVFGPSEHYSRARLLLEHPHACLPPPAHGKQAEAVFTIGEAFRGDHKAALAALASTTTLQFEYLDALLRPGKGSPLTPASSSSPEVLSDADKEVGLGGAWNGQSRQGGATRSAHPLPALAAGLDDGDRSLHVRLLVRFRPYEVYPFLSSSTGCVLRFFFVLWWHVCLCFKCLGF